MAFGFLPRRFEEGEVIYREQEEVPEMYLILDGIVDVGYVFFDMHIGEERTHLDKNKLASEYFAKSLINRSYFAEYYMFNNRKCDYLYKARTEVKAIGISKAHLFSVLTKHEKQGNLLREDANLRYDRLFRNTLVFYVIVIM